MMLSRESRVNRLENVLKQAYSAKKNRQVGEEWQGNVMRQIRQMQSVQQKEPLIWGSGRLAWQMMPATCVLVLLVGGVFFLSDAVTSIDMITTLYGNTQGTSIDALFFM